ncbi:MAG: ATP-binding cassette domain-containing protein [Polyangiaceae bacterium]
MNGAARPTPRLDDHAPPLPLIVASRLPPSGGSRVEVFVQVIVSNASYELATGRRLLDAVSATFSQGWSVVVGPNGAGKTTLLRLLAGAIRPTSGFVRHDPSGLRIAVIPQSLEAPSDLVATFAAARDRSRERLARELSLRVDELARWGSLSPGERRRLQIAAAIWDEADVLLCDEPDAHLDTAGLAELTGAMRAHRGIGVLVSHRRELVEELATSALWLEHGALTTYRGGYQAMRAQRDAERRGLLAERADRDRAVKSARAALDHARRRHDGAERSTSSRSRMKEKRQRRPQRRAEVPSGTRRCERRTPRGRARGPGSARCRERPRSRRRSRRRRRRVL